MANDEYVIRDAGEGDIPRIASFFREHKFALREESMIAWKYFSNPAGPARIFSVVDSNFDIKGILSFMPRDFVTSKGERMVLMQAVDAFVSPELRGKQMYSRLIKHSMDAIVAPVYTFPNKAAEGAELKSGWRLYSQVDSWFFPVKAGVFIRMRALKPLALIADILSKGYAFVRFGPHRNRIDIALIKRFKKDFDNYNGQAWGVRSAEYLNWRFVDNPVRRFSCYELMEGEETIGYCVIALKGRCAEMYDFVAIRSQRSCLRKIVDRCYSEGVAYLLFRCTGLNLRNLGFFKVRSLGNLVEHNLPKKAWTFTSCDSDWDD